MRNLALFFLLFTIVVLSRFVADVPLAIWCGEGYLRDRNIAVSNTVSIGDVENLMLSFVATSSVQEGFLSQYLSPNLHPEVVVVFAERKIRSDQLSIHKNSFTNLRNLIQTEKSSLVAPFVDLSVSFDNTIINMAHTIQGKQKVFYVGKGSTLLQDLKTQKSALTVVSQKLEETVPDSVFSNGVADLIVVYLDSFFSDLDNKFKESDATIKNVQSFISSKTTKYVGVYIGLEYDEPHLNSKFMGWEMPAVKHEKRYILQSVNATTNSTIPIFRQFFGGWFWELFLVCIILVPLMTCGMFAINGIQTPIFPKNIDKKHHHPK